MAHSHTDNLDDTALEVPYRCSHHGLMCATSWCFPALMLPTTMTPSSTSHGTALPPNLRSKPMASLAGSKKKGGYEYFCNLLHTHAHKSLWHSKLWMTRILSDAFKYMAADFLACAVEFQHIWLLCSALDLGYAFSSQRNLVRLPRVK